MESDVRGKDGEEQGRVVPYASSAAGQKNGRGSVPEPAQDTADDEWLASATGDPAFLIKSSDTV